MWKGEEGKEVFRWGGSLRTSFNSTLLWKLQLPLSRLAPGPHPSDTALFAVHNYTHWSLNPGGLEGGLRTLRHNPNSRMIGACVHMCLLSVKPDMHEKGTLKTFGEDKNL